MKICKYNLIIILIIFSMCFLAMPVQIYASSETCYHAFGEYVSDEKNGHYRVCSKCGYKEVSEHEYDRGYYIERGKYCTSPAVIGTDCVRCGYKMSEHVQGTVHRDYNRDELCDFCDKEMKLELRPGVCDHTYGEWKIDGDKGHQRICSKCNNKQISEHVMGRAYYEKQGKNATEKDIIASKCVDCDYKITEEIEHLGCRDYNKDGECDLCDELMGAKPEQETEGKEEEEKLSGNGKKGDINGDGKVTNTDIINLKQLLVEIISIEKELEKNADVDGNGSVSGNDLLAMKKHMVGMDTGFDWN